MNQTANEQELERLKSKVILYAGITTTALLLCLLQTTILVEFAANDMGFPVVQGIVSLLHLIGAVCCVVGPVKACLNYIKELKYPTPQVEQTRLHQNSKSSSENEDDDEDEIEDEDTNVNRW